MDIPIVGTHEQLGDENLYNTWNCVQKIYLK